MGHDESGCAHACPFDFQHTSRDGQLLSPPTSLDQGATYSQLHLTPLVQSPHQAEGTTSEDFLPGGSLHCGNSLSPSRHHGESPSGQSSLTPSQVLPCRLVHRRPSTPSNNNKLPPLPQRHSPHQSRGGGQVHFSIGDSTTSNDPELAVPSTLCEIKEGDGTTAIEGQQTQSSCEGQRTNDIYLSRDSRLNMCQDE